MQNNVSECASIEVSVTTAGGIVPLEGASVTVVYDKLPGICEKACQTQVTDKSGRTGAFKFPIRRAVIGGRSVDLPRRAECNIEICADGYTTLRVRGVHLFPDVTVMSSFDLMPLSNL